jgi:hypothetical protein
MKALLLLLLLGQSPGQLPASKTKVVVTESPSSRTVEVGDFANKAVRVNCVAGCSGSGSGGGSGDGKIIDGTATGQADVIGSAPAGTEQGLVTRNIPSGTQPVSGTFWQATQPVSGTFWQATQPISGSVTAIGPLTDTQLRATPVPVSGTLTATVSGVALDATLTGGTQKTKLVDTAGTNVATVSATGALKVDGSAVTQPVSGTFWQATQPVSGTFWQATQPVSAASLPLPSGAATSAKQPALGTAGTPSADVLTVQGVTSMTALKVDGSAVTQPVSGPLTDTQLRATAVPVSGTFWPATQPVSGTVTANAGTGTMAVSGTFWQATQPVSGPLTDTQRCVSGDRAAGVWDVHRNTATHAQPVPVSGRSSRPHSQSPAPSPPTPGPARWRSPVRSPTRRSAQRPCPSRAPSPRTSAPRARSRWMPR